jgi:hypothetical protein
MTIEDVVDRLGLREEAPAIVTPERQFILACMESDRLAIQGAAYQYLDLQRRRVEPPLSHDVFRDAYLGYLERCFRENPRDGWALERYEAAMEVRRWLGKTWLAGAKEDATILKTWLSVLFRTGDGETRDAIRFHVFCGLFKRDRSLRKFFAEWEKDPELCRASELG